MDYFDKNPIKITKLSKTQNVVLEKTYIVIGDVSKEIKKEIEKIPNNSSILKKKYGSNWKKKLGFATDVARETAWVFDVSIFEEDKIFELKQKIYMITGIPIYRQHLWQEPDNIPLAYTIYKYNNKININIQTILSPEKELKIIENIPVDIDIYENKDNIKVIAYDGFRILKDFGTEYFVTDMDDFTGSVKSNLEQMISPDKSRFNLTLDMIYYSFVLKYFPMITIPVFMQYIQDEQSMGEYFPELAPKEKELKAMYEKQDKIIRSKNEAKNLTGKIQQNIKSSIVVMVLNVIHNTFDQELLYLRNLFDLFDTDELTNFIQTILFYEGNRVMLKKIHIGCPEPTEKIQENSILFRIYLDTETNDSVDLLLFANGNYKIKTNWREEDNYGFKEVFLLTSKLITPIINKINSFGAMVLRYNDIPHMSWNNVTFTNISVSIFYRCAISDRDFELFKQSFQKLETANIAEQRSIDRNSMNYYFIKGMYKFDPMRIEKIVGIDNYYAYLSDSIVKTKWDSIFIKCRILRIMKRFSGIKIDINGIKKPEYDILMDYIHYILYEFTKNKKGIQTKQKLQLVKKLASLKEQDPILYDFKKKYGSRIIYSKICQKPFQPLLLTQVNYDQLSSSEKNRVLKWKNITTKEDVYYFCQNPKFPYVRFKIGKHPKGYGIPCCQKTNVSSDPTDPSHIIHQKILKDLVFLEEKTLKVSSRYVMTYGKDVEADRLSKLPEDTLEILLHEEAILDVDENCIKNTGYYLVGVSQHALNVNFIGYIYCLANVLNLNLGELIDQVIKRIKQSPQLFNILLQGRITKYFSSPKEFNIALNTIIESDIKIQTSASNYEKWTADNFNWWNTLFMDIAKYYFKINTIIFEDFGNREITLTIPPYINYPEEFIHDGYKNMIIIKKHKSSIIDPSVIVCHYYPIYIINKELYFKTKSIDRKLYSNNSSPIINVQKIIVFDMQQKKLQCIDLNTIKEFVKSGDSRSKYVIELLYINKQNLCYMIKLIYHKKHLNIPVEHSFYRLEGYNLSFEPYLRNKNPTQFSVLLQFIEHYNKWVQSHLKSEDLNIVYPTINIEYWVELRTNFNKPGKIVGLISNDLTYHFAPLRKSKALKYKKTTFIPLLYNLDDVNLSIFNNIDPLLDDRCKKIGTSLYKNNLYQLFVLQFMDTFSREKNNILRKKIYHILEIGVDLSKMIPKINSIIADYHEDDNNTSEDQQKITQQLRLSTHQKKDLVKDLELSRYNFDRTTINKLKNMEHQEVIGELIRISKKIFAKESILTTANIKNFTFPNIYVSCINYYKLNKSLPVDYCRDRKLKISASKLKEYIELFAGDIVDPLKFKYMCGLVLMGRVVDYFKFIRRPTEKIKIIIG